MAGHSKWSKVKHIKAVVDAKKGKIFGKLSKELTVAAKHGGGDPGFNPRLRTVLLKAKAINMPADNIDRAIKKGTGELPGVSYEEFTYEGYAAGGVALLVDVLTDNKNRAAAEVRALFTKHGGNLGVPGAVKHQFQHKGQIIVPREATGEDELMELVLEVGAEDMRSQDDSYEIITEPGNFEAVHKAIEDKGIKPAVAEVAWLPVTPVPVTDESTAASVLKLIEALEENDDVQNVHANFDIPDAVMEKVTAAASA
jgi:YebC/PmpR family DNA-binding regulatory protein